MPGKLIAALVLVLRFAWSVFVSGMQTMSVILRWRSRPQPGFMRYRFAPMSAHGAALLGSLITLTPGSTTIDVDLERRELLLHLLDASDPRATARSIRADLERWIVVLCAERPVR